jgi:hypothetical protein
MQHEAAHCMARSEIRCQLHAIHTASFCRVADGEVLKYTTQRRQLREGQSRASTHMATMAMCSHIVSPTNGTMQKRSCSGEHAIESSHVTTSCSCNIYCSTYAEPCGGVAEFLVHDLGEGINVLGEEVEVLSHGCRGHRCQESKAKHGEGWGCVALKSCVV